MNRYYRTALPFAEAKHQSSEALKSFTTPEIVQLILTELNSRVCQDWQNPAEKSTTFPWIDKEKRLATTHKLRMILTKYLEGTKQTLTNISEPKREIWFNWDVRTLCHYAKQLITESISSPATELLTIIPASEASLDDNSVIQVLEMITDFENEWHKLLEYNIPVDWVVSEIMVEDWGDKLIREPQEQQQEQEQQQ